MALQWRAEQVPGTLLTAEDIYILTVLDAHRGRALPYDGIAKESVEMNRADRGMMPRRLNDTIIRQRMPVLLALELVARPVGTKKKGVGITSKGIQALRFAVANPPETERKK